MIISMNVTIKNMIFSIGNASGDIDNYSLSVMVYSKYHQCNMWVDLEIGLTAVQMMEVLIKMAS